jgi:hypothetical protein
MSLLSFCPGVGSSFLSLYKATATVADVLTYIQTVHRIFRSPECSPPSSLRSLLWGLPFLTLYLLQLTPLYAMSPTTRTSYFVLFVLI